MFSCPFMLQLPFSCILWGEWSSPFIECRWKCRPAAFRDSAFCHRSLAALFIWKCIIFLSCIKLSLKRKLLSGSTVAQKEVSCGEFPQQMWPLDKMPFSFVEIQREFIVTLHEAKLSCTKIWLEGSHLLWTQRRKAPALTQTPATYRSKKSNLQGLTSDRLQFKS